MRLCRRREGFWWGGGVGRCTGGVVEGVCWWLGGGGGWVVADVRGMGRRLSALGGGGMGHVAGRGMARVAGVGTRGFGSRAVDGRDGGVGVESGVWREQARGAAGGE